ncbi:MAG: hypothetical protein SGJ16_04195 [Nitrospirota bacterium]|nr:hypothetical protein [Nitrospirota bacterium]
MMVLAEDIPNDETVALRDFEEITIVNPIVLALAGVETLGVLLALGPLRIATSGPCPQ